MPSRASLAAHPSGRRYRAPSPGVVVSAEEGRKEHDLRHSIGGRFRETERAAEERDHDADPERWHQGNPDDSPIDLLPRAGCSRGGGAPGYLPGNGSSILRECLVDRELRDAELRGDLTNLGHREPSARASTLWAFSSVSRGFGSVIGYLFENFA
jgi:hypothetical protein